MKSWLIILIMVITLSPIPTTNAGNELYLEDVAHFTGVGRHEWVIHAPADDLVTTTDCNRVWGVIIIEITMVTAEFFHLFAFADEDKILNTNPGTYLDEVNSNDTEKSYVGVIPYISLSDGVTRSTFFNHPLKEGDPDDFKLVVYYEHGLVAEIGVKVIGSTGRTLIGCPNLPPTHPEWFPVLYGSVLTIIVALVIKIYKTQNANLSKKG